MALPDIGKLHINGTLSSQNGKTIIPEDVANTEGNREMEKLKNLARLLPFSIEPNSSMQQMLDLIILRIYQAIQAQDYDIGFLQWDTMLTLFVVPLLFCGASTSQLCSQLDCAQISGPQGQTDKARKAIF